ncbi:Casein kinase I-like protein [Smittium culicis]|uniref:Casein kinase I-like protein n=1 Tax=Smittium culicis TaxID=133412 RepID=A0A1R1XGH3_9FUNG|nr:Casein kinase I-like protein [Smittium culicis]
MGKQNSKYAGKVFLVDFGMAKLYRDPKTHIHVPYRERKSLSGTARYMSINTHLGREQSRRDDLESIGHVIMYFLRGALPWQGLKAANNKQKYEKIGQKKQYTSVKELCEGFPEEFGIYLSTVRKYSFEETPDYDYLRDLMDAAIRRVGETDDGVYDWMVPSMGYGSESGLQNVILFFSSFFSPFPKYSRGGLAPNAKDKNLHSSNLALVSFHNKTSRTQTGNQQDMDSNPNINSREHLSSDGLNNSNAKLSNKQPTPVNKALPQPNNPNSKNPRNDQYSQPTNTNHNTDNQSHPQNKGFLAKLFSCSCFS